MEQVDVLDLASRQELSPAQVQELTYLQLQKLCADKGLGGRGCAPGLGDICLRDVDIHFVTGLCSTCATIFCSE